MDKETKKKIKNMVLTLREMFENEIENRLNYYGIYRDKAWKDGRSLRYLSSEELSNKKRVEAFIKRQESAGLSQSQATVEFIKEASYTWINRLIGLKCMETRGLIDEEAITVRDEFGSRSERHRNFVVMEHPELANTPDGGLILCLMDVFREVTEEKIKILFDPENEYSLIVPRYRCLKDAIDLINKSVDYDVYKEDELLGWVYQYFQTKEKDRIFEEVRTKKKKISGSDIIPVTSLYTEKYMVQFLVENSLGAIWMEMYPDSELYANWVYFVKDPNKTTREPRPIKELKFLDPACGSGHFLLYAFDLFFQMYNEEGVVPEEDIPNYILKYNLHGIDIDLRSVQISALSLWMKAKSKNRDIKIEQMNLVAANAIMLDSDILGEFLEEFGDDVLAKELVTTIWRGLQNVRELGSLLKVEEQIDAVIERVKGQTRVGEAWDKEQFTWERWKQQIMDKLRSYYEKAAETFDINKQMFANETIKGLNFIDLISQKYDVVATNPPYMGKMNMGKSLNIPLKELYPSNFYDLYTVFIDRNIGFCNNFGFVSMVTQQTFMFIQSYRGLREKILKDFKIRTVAHLGPHAFEDIGGEIVNIVMFTLKTPIGTDQYYSTFFNITKESPKDKKLLTLIKNEGTSNLVFIISQKVFVSIIGNPFAYRISKSVQRVFANRSSFEGKIIFKSGIITGNNDRFLRYFWEIKEGNAMWVPYHKGGEFNDYFFNPNLVIDWSAKAKYFYSTYPMARIRNENHHFIEGITFNAIATSKGINAKYLSPKTLFDHMGASLLVKGIGINIFLGLLNSKLFNHMLNLINPSIKINGIDIPKLPFVPPGEETENTLDILVEGCINVRKSLLQFVINDREFKQPALMWSWENVTRGDMK